MLTERAWERVRDPSGRAGKGPGNIPAKKSRDRSTRGNCSGFCNFSDVGVINSVS